MIRWIVGALLIFLGGCAAGGPLPQRGRVEKTSTNDSPTADEPPPFDDHPNME